MRIARYFAAALAGAMNVTGLCGVAQATELEPHEVVAVPPGTTVFLAYGLYGHHDKITPVSGPDLEDGTNLDLNLGIARLAHYFNVGDTLALVEVLQPFGSLDHARVAGTRLRRSAGLGDTILAAVAWPINDAKRQRYLAFTVYLTVPTGKYDKNEPLNLGGNRMVYNPQLGLSQGIGKGWSVDVSADMIFYGANNDAGAGGTQRLTQAETVQIQAFLNHAWPGGVSTSIGYQGLRGGKQRLDGIDTGNRTNFNEVRFVASKFLTPKFQLLGEVNHQFDATGGFRQDFGFLMRALYVF
ncbi:transporter [Novosphingobium naphthalenivorans]|uniref:transporter n=1 Tax=Novosphingobium naphthalenivorans TaxID=273168 RepID=UPI0008315610|nr:transporter [Novosphingobium naphthalenivorans]